MHYYGERLYGPCDFPSAIDKIFVRLEGFSKMCEEAAKRRQAGYRYDEGAKVIETFFHDKISYFQSHHSLVEHVVAAWIDLCLSRRLEYRRALARAEGRLHEK